VGDFEELPSGDTISYYVQQGRNLSGGGVITTVGEFRLLKKR
jgi:hypothetical protein